MLPWGCLTPKFVDQLFRRVIIGRISQELFRVLKRGCGISRVAAKIDDRQKNIAVSRIPSHAFL